MTALTADREPSYKQGIDLPYQLAASTTIYAGSLVMLEEDSSTLASTTADEESVVEGCLNGQAQGWRIGEQQCWRRKHTGSHQRKR